MKYFKLLLSLIFSLILLISCRDTITEPTDEIIEEKPVVLNLQPISYPIERVEWVQGETHDIKWRITQNLDNVKIVLLKKYNEIYVISEKTENDGHFNWLIPADLPGSHHYRIKIMSPYNYSAASTSVEFEIQESEFGPTENK